MIEALRYPTGTKLAGVVFVQQLETFATSACESAFRQSIEALKELRGDTTLKNVVIMIRHRDKVKPEVEQRLNSNLCPWGCFHPAIEQGAQVYHCTGTSKPDLGALRLILGDRRTERDNSDTKNQEDSMQEVMNKKVEELRRELEEQKGKAREEADGLRKRIAEMQSKLEEDRHTSGKALEFLARSFLPHLKAFLVGPCAYLALQRVYPLIDLHPNLLIVSMTYFTARSMNDVCKTSRRITLFVSFTIWTRQVTMSPFLTDRSSWPVGSRQSRSFVSRFSKVLT